MITPYKKIIVYDLETGGLDNNINSITEIAMVVIDMENLEIVDEFSVMISPYADLSYIKNNESGRAESKRIFKNLSIIDNGKKVLNFRNENLQVLEISKIEEELQDFKTLLDKNSYSKGLLKYSDIITLLKDESASDAMKLYLNQTYNPQALDATKISLNLLVKEGIDIEKAFKQSLDFIKKHTIGNSKPLIAGHNIIKFDNLFLEKFFKQNDEEMFKYFSDRIIIDTIDWARLRWFDTPNYTLGTCCNQLDITLKSAHRALPDTIANAKFLAKMLKSFRGEGSQETMYIRKKFNLNIEK